jgi:hypothetical protein
LAKNFNPAKYLYSCWAIPLVFTLLGGALGVRRFWAKVSATIAIGLLLALEGLATHELAVHGSYFAHTAYPMVRQVLAALPPQDTAVVHEASRVYPLLYFAIRFDGQGLPQYVATPRGEPCLGGKGIDAGRGEDVAELQGYRRLVVVNAREQQAVDLARQMRFGDDPVGPGSFLRALESGRQWRRVSHELSVAFVTADVVVLERTAERDGK